MTGIEEKIKKKIISIIKAVIPNTKIILYGSRARGDYNKHSDIDLALDNGQKIERIDVGEVSDLLQASHIPYKIDVVDLHNISETMRAIIIKEGIPWND